MSNMLLEVEPLLWNRGKVLIIAGLTNLNLFHQESKVTDSFPSLNIVHHIVEMSFS